MKEMKCITEDRDRAKVKSTQISCVPIIIVRKKKKSLLNGNLALWNFGYLFLLICISERRERVGEWRRGISSTNNHSTAAPQ